MKLGLLLPMALPIYRVTSSTLGSEICFLAAFCTLLFFVSYCQQYKLTFSKDKSGGQKWAVYFLVLSLSCDCYIKGYFLTTFSVFYA